MMKVPPTIATCLFGPSGVPPRIRPCNSNEESIPTNTTKRADILQDGDNCTDKIQDSVSGGRESIDSMHTDTGENQNQESPKLKELSNGTAIEKRQSIPDETPPHSPLKPDMPSRPSKTQPNKMMDPKNLSASLQNMTCKSNALPPLSSESSSSTPTPHTINLQELRRITAQGIPDSTSYRALAWRILLRYLPLETSEWQSTLDRDRKLYRDLVEGLFVFPENEPFVAEGRALRGMWWERRRTAGKKKSSDVKPDAGTEISNNSNSEAIKGSSSKDSANSIPLSSSSEIEVNQSSSSLEDPNMNAVHRKFYTLTDEERRAHLDRAISATRPKNDLADRNSVVNQECEKMAKLIPERIQLKWKNSGRDISSLFAGLCANRHNMHSSRRKFLNALLIPSTMGVMGNNENGKQEQRDGIIDIQKTKSEDEEEKNNAIDAEWAQIFEKASLLDEIRKDVVRTHPDLSFFLEVKDNVGRRRYAALERILFVWAQLNKGVRYVQGMNEIVGTMYFVLANDTNEEWAREAEADTYFLFNTLMVEMRDIFVPDLDEADTGIQGRMSNMIALLSLHDPEVRCHLDDCGIDPAFYSIRWLTTLLSREFFLPDTIRLWDSMFASTHKDNFMRYVCVSMVMIIRERLLKGDFGTCLRLLQKYPSTNIDQLLEASRALWIYESQVTLACHKGGISLSQALVTITPPPSVIMAYGLSGGVAADELERMRKEGKKQFGGRNNALSNSKTATKAAKTLLGLFGASGRKGSRRHSSR